MSSNELFPKRISDFCFGVSIVCYLKSLLKILQCLGGSQILCVDLMGSNKDKNHILAFPQWEHLYFFPSFPIPPSENMLKLKCF